MDVCDQPTITAAHHRVVATFLATTIGFDGVVVSTIEHVMAALSGCGIDNVLVEVDGPEVPILDGSAAPYLDVLKEAGLKEQRAARKCLSVTRPLLVKDGDAYIRATPSDHFRVVYSIDFPHPLVGKQKLSWSFDKGRFGREIAKARTFGFLKDVQQLQSQGLAQGGSLANAIVFDESRLLNHEGFRYSDECVRHKVLDFIGDLALAGMALLGTFEAHKAGHALHHRFLRQLIAETSAATVSPVTCTPALSFPHGAIPTFREPFPPLAKSM